MMKMENKIGFYIKFDFKYDYVYMQLCSKIYYMWFKL